MFHSTHYGRSSSRLRHGVAVTTVAFLAGSAGSALADDGRGHDSPTWPHDRRPALRFEPRTLDGSGNNVADPQWGAVGALYLRRAGVGYADGMSTMAAGPNPRYVSNRVFNDTGQNVFSARGVTQWVWTWGQLLDHTFGLREEGGENAPITLDVEDPLEDFGSRGVVAFERSPAAPGTGVDTPREQVNTVSSYIDAWAVYGGTEKRLDWLRDGPTDGTLANNAASLLMPDGYLPQVTARGDATTAPEMQLVGRLIGAPNSAVVAGDVRANENLALTAAHTLLAREHNRIVAALPAGLDEQLKFEIARRAVGAEQQYITYNEFLPAVGVHLDRYRGYDPDVDASLSNEFAAAAYRMHSMIHGEFELEVDPGTYADDDLAAFAAEGIEIEEDGESLQLAVPLQLAFGNPGLVPRLGLGPVLASLAGAAQYANDEQIDNQLRSVLFQIPNGALDPDACLGVDPPPECFTDVLDLGAIDIARGRDHGIPTYNELRSAFGLPVRTTFTEVTGENTGKFPTDPNLDTANPIDDSDILDFTVLLDADGATVEPGSAAAEEEVITAQRRTTLAARLKAIYGSVERLDAFTGMLAEQRLNDSELGELQAAIWLDQFERLRDGDRFFYANDPVLDEIEKRYGITYRVTLAQLIAANTDIDEIQADVFRVTAEEEQPDVAEGDDRTAADTRGHDEQRTCRTWSARRRNESAGASPTFVPPRA